MKLQTLLLGTAATTLLMLSGCATATQAQDTAQAGEHILVKKIKMKDGKALMAHVDGDENIFVMKSGDGHTAMDLDMDVDVQTDENGETIVMINGEKVDGDTHVWKSKDGKGVKVKVKRMAFDTDMKDHKKLMKKMKKHHKHTDGKSIFIVKDGEKVELLADSKHARKTMKRLHTMVDGEHGKKESQIFAFIGGDEGGHEGFPHTIDIKDGMQIIVQEGGNVKIMKDGKEISADQHNMNVEKSVSVENGKRKTKIVIETIEDE